MTLSTPRMLLALARGAAGRATVTCSGDSSPADEPEDDLLASSPEVGVGQTHSLLAPTHRLQLGCLGERMRRSREGWVSLGDGGQIGSTRSQPPLGHGHGLSLIPTETAAKGGGRCDEMDVYDTYSSPHLTRLARQQRPDDGRRTREVERQRGRQGA